MKYRVVIETRAERDIDAIVVWLAEESERVAVNWYRALHGAIKSLEQFPERCPSAPENGFVPSELRQLLHGSGRHLYRILFTVDNGQVHVLHVRHGAQDWLGANDFEGPA